MERKPNVLPLMILVFLVTAGATVAVTALLMNISDRKAEGREQHVRLVEVTRDTTDPAVWGKNWPREYDGYKRTVDQQRTRYGGSEAFSHLEDDPRLKKIFAGYAFAIDYREERGHWYSLSDQDETERVKKKKQPGACLHCHASIIPAYREQGNGDVMKGFAEVCKMDYHEARKLAEHPVSCVDCHDPETMALVVTRPGFLNGIRELKKLEGIENYDPNTMATRQEMRSFVCGQCHVEYYFKGDGKLVTYPWHKGLKVEQIEAYYDEVGWKDWEHEISKAPALKAQHPEFELWNQGTHARAGVACADCHMPYVREGAVKISDHHVRSPLLNVERSCQVCHAGTAADELLDRAQIIQGRNKELLIRSEEAVVGLIDAISGAMANGATDEQLAKARKLQRKAQWRTDFINAENSMGFHAPQEAARILAEAIDYARQGELAVLKATGGVRPPAPPPVTNVGLKQQ